MPSHRALGCCVVALACSACGDDGVAPADAPPESGPPGVWVSALIGDDQNPGTSTRPVRTIARGIALANGVATEVHVGQGDYAEVPSVIEGLSLLGGFDCAAAPCKDGSSPALFVSRIVLPDPAGIIVPSDVTRATSIDGFTILGQSTGPGGDEARALLVEGSPTITNNVIQGPYTTGNGTMPGTPSTAVRIGGDADPLIEGNRVILGMGYTTQHQGIVAATSTTRGEVRNNRIELTGGTGMVGVVAGATLVVKNDFSTTAPIGGGPYIVVRGAATIDRNSLTGTNNPTAIYVTGAGVAITNNVLVGGGIEIVGTASRPAIVISSNLIDAERAISLQSSSVGTLVFGRIRNNILRLRGAQQRVGIFQGSTADAAAVPEVVENNVFWFADDAPGTYDALWLKSFTNSATSLTTIEQVNAEVNAANNQLADPLLSGSHLTPGSPCIDTGTATDAPAVDIDGQTRPRGAGFDIGPDEL